MFGSEHSVSPQKAQKIQSFCDSSSPILNSEEPSLFLVQDPDEVIAKLRFDRPDDLSFLPFEGGLFKLRDHPTLAKPAQVSATLAGRALGIFAGHLSKALLAGCQQLFDL